MADRENNALNCQFSGRDSKRRPKFVTDDKPLPYDSSTKTVLGPMKHGARFSYIGVLSHLRLVISGANLIMRG